MMKADPSFKYLVFFWTLLIANVKGGELRTCSRDYDKVGCYDEYNPGIKDLIVFDRYGIQWEKIEAYMHNLACRCEAKARALNKERNESEKYIGFALHFWGECYGRTQAQVNSLALKSKSGRCTGDQTFTKCYDKNPECTGHAFSEFVFTIRPGKAEKRTLRHCNGGGLKLSCSKDLEVAVTKISYGEKTSKVCGEPLSVGWEPVCSKVDHSTVSNYFSFCIGKSVCNLPDWTKDPLDPCPKVNKFIDVEYQCNPLP